MSKEKQIEKMATELCGINKACKDCALDKLCLAQNSAKILYAADYLKQTKGEWIEKPHFAFDGGYSGANYECSNCHFDDIYDLDNMNYCPNCGAKMTCQNT